MPAPSSTIPGERLARRLSLREARDWTLYGAPFAHKESLYFLHVPKAGGTSFDAFLSGFFTDAEHSPAEMQIERPDLWTQHDRSRHRYRHGAFWLSDVLPQQQGAHFVTFLRDPIKRVVSHYWHLRLLEDITDDATRWQDHRRQVREHARAHSLAEWAATAPGQPCAYVRNLFTRMLGGVRYVPGMGADDCAGYLERAKSNLERVFVYFGLLEDYARSKQVFCQTFGLPPHYAQGEERCNTSPFAEARQKPDDATLQRIREDNALDVELYRFAQELFEKRVAMLKRLPADPLYAPLKIWPHPFVADGGYTLAAEDLRGAGLYRPDRTVAGGLHTWTGRLPQTTLDLAAALPRRGEVEIRLHTVANVTPLDRLVVRLDGAPTRELNIEYHSDHQEIVCRFDLTADICARTVHALELLGPLATPVDASGRPTETRRLGIALRRVDVAWRRRGLIQQVRNLLVRRAA